MNYFENYVSQKSGLRRPTIPPTASNLVYLPDIESHFNTHWENNWQALVSDVWREPYPRLRQSPRILLAVTAQNEFDQEVQVYLPLARPIHEKFLVVSDHGEVITLMRMDYKIKHIPSNSKSLEAYKFTFYRVNRKCLIELPEKKLDGQETGSRFYRIRDECGDRVYPIFTFQHENKSSKTPRRDKIQNTGKELKHELINNFPTIIQALHQGVQPKINMYLDCVNTWIVLQILLQHENLP